MKKLIIGLAVIIIAVGSWYFFYQNRSTKTVLPTPSPINDAPAQDASVYCTPDQIQPQISVEGAAGNIYGTVTIKNTSAVDCQVMGNNIEIQYNPAIKNIKIAPQGQSSAVAFTLAPDQSIYSQLHYPNGPQCSGSPKPVDITITYKISPTNSVTLRALDGKDSFSIPTCESETEITTIDLWTFSIKPITP